MGSAAAARPPDSQDVSREKNYVAEKRYKRNVENAVPREILVDDGPKIAPVVKTLIKTAIKRLQFHPFGTTFGASEATGHGESIYDGSGADFVSRKLC